MSEWGKLRETDRSADSDGDITWESSGSSSYGYDSGDTVLSSRCRPRYDRHRSYNRSAFNESSYDRHGLGQAKYYDTRFYSGAVTKNDGGEPQRLTPFNFESMQTPDPVINESQKFTPSSLGWTPDSDFVKRYDLIFAKGKEPYLQLLSRWTPSSESPSRVWLDTPSHVEKNTYPCRFPTKCGRVFKRPADLDRHYKHVHAPAEQRMLYTCDYRNCSRSKDGQGFSRRDHYTDHLGFYHKEDLGLARLLKTKTKGKKTFEETWKERDRIQNIWWAERRIERDWWRCDRCLERLKVGGEDDRWWCQSCNIACEFERRERRQKLFGAPRWSYIYDQEKWCDVCSNTGWCDSMSEGRHGCYVCTSLGPTKESYMFPQEPVIYTIYNDSRFEPMHVDDAPTESVSAEHKVSASQAADIPLKLPPPAPLQLHPTKDDLHKSSSPAHQLPQTSDLTIKPPFPAPALLQTTNVSLQSTSSPLPPNKSQNFNQELEESISRPMHTVSPPSPPSHTKNRKGRLRKMAARIFER